MLPLSAPISRRYLVVNNVLIVDTIFVHGYYHFKHYKIRANEKKKEQYFFTASSRRSLNSKPLGDHLVKLDWKEKLNEGLSPLSTSLEVTWLEKCTSLIAELVQQPRSERIPALLEENFLFLLMNTEVPLNSLSFSGESFQDILALI